MGFAREQQCSPVIATFRGLVEKKTKMRPPRNPVESWLFDLPQTEMNPNSQVSSRWLLGSPPSARSGLSLNVENLTTRSSPALVTPNVIEVATQRNPPIRVETARKLRDGDTQSRQRVIKLELKVAQRDRTISTLQTTIRNLSSYIRQLEQLNEVPENGSLGGTADSSRRLPARINPPSLIEFTPRLRLNQIRDLNKQASSPIPISSSDDIDEVVQKFLESRDMIGAIRRVSYGVYSVGDGPRRISVCVKNNKPLVRSGGGSYLHLDMYLSNH
jgi:hypothetical protein